MVVVVVAVSWHGRRRSVHDAQNLEDAPRRAAFLIDHSVGRAIPDVGDGGERSGQIAVGSAVATPIVDVVEVVNVDVVNVDVVAGTALLIRRVITIIIVRSAGGASTMIIGGGRIALRHYLFLGHAYKYYY